MNYAELSAAIQSYMENTFPDTYLADGGTVSSKTQIDTFIKQAEQRIGHTFRKDVTLVQIQESISGTGAAAFALGGAEPRIASWCM
jgi:hypothetical protein